MQMSLISVGLVQQVIGEWTIRYTADNVPSAASEWQKNHEDLSSSLAGLYIHDRDNKTIENVYTGHVLGLRGLSKGINLIGGWCIGGNVDIIHKGDCLMDNNQQSELQGTQSSYRDLLGATTSSAMCFPSHMVCISCIPHLHWGEEFVQKRSQSIRRCMIHSIRNWTILTEYTKRRSGKGEKGKGISIVSLNYETHPESW